MLLINVSIDSSTKKKSFNWFEVYCELLFIREEQLHSLCMKTNVKRNKCKIASGKWTTRNNTSVIHPTNHIYALGHVYYI
jgi:hypothetical protein